MLYFKLIAMQAITINRGKIIDFIKSVDGKLEAQLNKDGKIYETPLRSFLFEGLIIAEQRFKNEDAQSNLHYIRETKIQSQNEILRYQFLISESWSKNYSDTEAVIKRIHERIKVQEYLIQFMDLLHNEYLESYFLSQETDSINQINKLEAISTYNTFINTKWGTRYYLEESFYDLYERQYLIEEIKNVGHFSIDYKGNKVRVYIGDIAALFAAKQVEVKDLETGKIEMIVGNQFLNIYVIRFNEGSEYFKSTYRASPNILFGPEAKAFGEGLHFQYFHSQENSEGWQYWTKTTPRIITQKIIGDYGYFAGIISSFEQMASEYTDLFSKYVFPSCNKNDVSEDQEMIEPTGEPIAEITISDINDYAKLQRGVISLLQQVQDSRGNAMADIHPFLWHTKVNEISTPYILKVNNDEEVTDENGKIIERKKVSITDNDVDEAFINYITSCHINQIAPFLTYQFEHFYNRLKADEYIQPFFNHILSLAKTAKQRGVLYRLEADTLTKWIETNPHYQHKTALRSLPNLDTSTLKATDSEGLTQRQRILKYFYERGNMVERKHKEYNDYNKYCTTKKRLNYPNDSESKLKHLIKDIEKVLLLLSNEFKQVAETELITLKNRLTIEN